MKDMHGIPATLRRFIDAQWIFGYLLLGTGILLVLIVTAYYGYRYWSKTTMDQLTFASARPLSALNVPTDGNGKFESVAAPVTVLKSAEATVPVTNGSGVASDSLKQTHIKFEDDDESGPAPQSVAKASNYYAHTSTASTTKHSVQVVDDDSNNSVAAEPANRTGQSLPLGSDMSTQFDQPKAVVPEFDQKSQQTDASDLRPSQISTVDDALPARAEENSQSEKLLPLAYGFSESDLRTFMTPTPKMLQLAGAAPSRIIIPAIDVDSNVAALKLLSKNTGYEWETPKGIVGHVPTSGNPGIARQGWYFGHLESPLRREGNVFNKLPDIPALLKGGEIVHIVIETDDRSYLYEVYKTDLVHEKDLTIKYSLDQDITLVTCYPTLVYDHRLLVTAALVGMSKS